ncbi:hypothetical protein VO63_31855 [Streptomyces showdoensis]|uniref:Uncharacterized protein n=1 Tax=Streptomyces showdoensis TaxID=68268 RepID=A0A2P2GED3_STREW|nr:hypothetical protein VO63_31855 [Streptomyces showdoensis]
MMVLYAVVSVREIHPGPGYPALCAAYGVEPVPGSHGLLLMQEKGGEGRKTLVSPDLGLCRMVADAIRPDFLHGEVIELPASAPFTTVTGWIEPVG